VPAQKTTKSVALPSPPAQKSVAPAKAEPAAKPVTVAVPPPVEPAAKAAQNKQPVAMATKETAPATKSVEKDTTVKVAPAPASKKATALIPPAPAPAPVPVKSVRAAEPANQVDDGAFMLDAGSYLMESNRNILVAKIKKLGYKPLVTPIDATLDMTRLRLGTFSKDEVKEALDFARTIEPGAYSAPAGDGYVVYAGTFLKTGNVDKLIQRFLKEGIKVHPEPVQVVRILNRIRFGSFATKADATAVARELSTSGLKAVVVKSK
jgi:cell division septation protein DedD